MAREKPIKVRGLLYEHGSYVVRMVVPADVRSVFGKTEFRQNLRTDSATIAARECSKLTKMWKGWIGKARAGETPEAIINLVHNWKTTQSRRAYVHSEPVTPENELVRLLYLGLAGSQASGVDQVAAGIGLADTQRGRLEVAKALMQVEQARILNGRATIAVEAANAANQSASNFEQAAFGAITKVDQVAELSGWSIGSFYNKWSEGRTTSDARLPHEALYIRALKDFMGGDCDLALITEMKVFDFWRQVEKFPARRDKSLSKLSFNNWISRNQKFEGTDSWIKPIGTSTQKNWLKFYRQMFKRAISLRVVSTNPFDAVELKLVGGPITGQALTPEGLKAFFGHPFFDGPRDARWWLPVAGLFTGCRLDELVSSYVEDFKQIEGIWFLDLEGRPIENGAERRVKNESSQRLVPIHPKLLEMGFITWVQAQGTGTARVFPRSMATYSQFFSNLMSKAGVTKMNGSSQSFHGLRHTFERRGRDCGVHLEMRDLLTGHKGQGMGCEYGKGLAELVRYAEMSKITFPTFPISSQ
ncbi:MAG: site-specific integrase [Caulobacteraceae bacterium]|nr:site-specific integrase [Caulobacteraceae bacterium]